MRWNILLGICLMLISCSKSTSDDPPGVHNIASLKGKWIFTEYFMSPGDAGRWYPANPAGQYVELKNDNTISSNMPMFSKITGFEVQDSVLIRFFTPAEPSGYIVYQFSFDDNKKILSLSPYTYRCIEGCAYRFRRP